MINQKRAKYIIAILLVAASIFCYYLISTDEACYKKTIAKITSITETADQQTEDMYGNIEQIYTQQICAVIMNGVHKGEKIQLQNTTSYSEAYDLKLKIGDEVFVSLTQKGNTTVSAKILDVKRDKYISYIVILFILLILLIGGKKGLSSLISLIANIIIFAIVIELYLYKCNLVFITSTASIFFIIISISLVCGINRKAVSAAAGTMAGTMLSMLIAVAVIMATHGNGIHYEEMEFITNFDYSQIFLAEILIGTLGGIMDIAISISSAINELYEKNPDIDRKTLINSGVEIGKDIMGTMANTLFFAYISGSIPMILLLLRNGCPIFNIIGFNISLEIIRALTGSIGIVISIPITLYISVMLVGRNKIGSVSV